jgi:hypothetical protein
MNTDLSYHITSAPVSRFRVICLITCDVDKLDLSNIFVLYPNTTQISHSSAKIEVYHIKRPGGLVVKEGWYSYLQQTEVRILTGFIFFLRSFAL